MRRLLPCTSATVGLLTLLLTGLGRAQDHGLARILEGSPAHGLPGAVAGTERWIVHFEQRSFDLEGVRAAVLRQRPAAEITELLADIEQRMRADQAGFVADVQRTGGRVVQQWWLVNAAAIEIAPERMAAIRALPNVRMVQPDLECSPTMKVATNVNNHNADLVQAWGFKGQGAAVAILDSGHDENMGGSGRPHRLYFVDGNPANLTGGGIGGSRLLLNRQVGAMPADDVVGHGTFVASIAAGENWGIPEADQGHAPRAGIAGYAIADLPGGNSSYLTMATAWQQMAADRVPYGIVAANLSYSAEPHPLSVEQQAADSAALNFDVLYTVSAGNMASDTTKSPCATNGLAIGAVTHDSHQVWASSAVGPLSGDSQRFYPDMVACGVGIDAAAMDLEASYGTANGTSAAAPQVAGAATQLRARFPALTALQTKAILFASSLDVAAQNPGLTRNHYGMGFLRNDRAHQVAAGNNFHSGAVTTAAPSVVTMPVVAGRPYSVAITWFRHDLTATTWSNLDLTVRDATTLAVLATSTSTRNLYEMVRFTPGFTGAVRIEVTAAWGSGPGGGPQQYACAWFDGQAPARDAVSYGAGCPGAGRTLVVNGALNPTATVLSPNHAIGDVEYAYLFSSTTPTTFDAIEVLAQGHVQAATAIVNIRLVDITGQPSFFTIATGRLTAGTETGWCRATFPAPVTVSGACFVGIKVLSGAMSVQLLGAGMPTLFYYDQFGTWQASPTVAEVGMRKLLRTANSGAVPHFRVDGQINGGPPLAFGTTTDLRISEAMPNTYAVGLIGFHEVDIPLAGLGAAGCTLLSSAEIMLATAVDAAGEGLVQLPLTTVVDAHYLEIYGQYAVLDPINPFGFVTSNGLRLTIGP